MKKVENHVAEQLWAQLRDQVQRTCETVIIRSAGSTPRMLKIMAKEKALCELVVDMMAEAYRLGLDRGYNTGHEVFGGGA